MLNSSISDIYPSKFSRGSIWSCKIIDVHEVQDERTRPESRPRFKPTRGAVVLMIYRMPVCFRRWYFSYEVSEFDVESQWDAHSFTRSFTQRHINPPTHRPNHPLTHTNIHTHTRVRTPHHDCAPRSLCFVDPLWTWWVRSVNLYEVRAHVLSDLNFCIPVLCIRSSFWLDSSYVLMSTNELAPLFCW